MTRKKTTTQSTVQADAVFWSWAAPHQMPDADVAAGLGGSTTPLAPAVKSVDDKTIPDPAH